MIRLVIIILFFLASNSIFAQDYYNRIFDDFSFSPNPTNIIDISGDTVTIGILSTVNGYRSSSFIQYDQSNDTYDYYELQGYSLNFDNVFRIKNNYYLYGDKNFNVEDTLVLLKLSDSFEIREISEYTNPGYGGALTATSLDNHLYGVSGFDIINGNHNETNVRKLDTLGSEFWSKDIGAEKKLNAAYEINPSKDGNLFLSSNVVYTDKFGAYAQLIKLDTSGQEIWRYEGEERFENGAIAPWIVELSDSTIVQYYEIDANQANDIVLQWIDKNGNPLQKRVYESPSIDEFGFRQMEAGKGDYFFAYGNYDDFNEETTDRPSYGLLTKYNNQGDTIWAHKYRHPDFSGERDIYLIEDIVEQDNGDLIVLASIFVIGEPSRIWLFKLDADGCPDIGVCQDYILFSSVDEELKSLQPKIYPNPTSSEINIDFNSEIFSGFVEIYNLYGQQLVTKKINSASSQVINISGLISGQYIIKFTDEQGSFSGSQKFVVIK